MKKLEELVLIAMLKFSAVTGWHKLSKISERLVTKYCHKYGIEEFESILGVLYYHGNVSSRITYYTDAKIPLKLELMYMTNTIGFTWD